jgi:predicted  nucleic acid-binding Zn-ribbon protein
VTQLDLLRKALQEAMQAVEERGVQLQKQARPQTLDEAEKLEKELTDALKELQAMKKQMK